MAKIEVKLSLGRFSREDNGHWKVGMRPVIPKTRPHLRKKDLGLCVGPL
jgi:hypothetical protein